jgi:hypothetical protein
MSVQPVHHPHQPRVPRTIDGIAAALSPSRRMAFYREVGQAEAGEQLQHVVATWWGEAMLDTDPDRERITAAANAGTLTTVSWDQVHRRRRERAGEMPGE